MLFCFDIAHDFPATFLTNIIDAYVVSTLSFSNYHTVALKMKQNNTLKSFLPSPWSKSNMLTKIRPSEIKVLKSFLPALSCPFPSRVVLSFPFPTFHFLSFPTLTFAVIAFRIFLSFLFLCLPFLEDFDAVKIHIMKPSNQELDVHPHITLLQEQGFSFETLN